MASASLYCALKHRRDIRLLRVKSNTRGRRIGVSLEVSKLDSNVPYTALSYVWGNPTPPSWIICNGHDVPITYNLFMVLSQLQQQEDYRLLWVDAICINQKDNVEKSIQVNMMRDIYKQAANVIFWLGPEEQYDKAAVRLMNVFVKNNGMNSELEPLRVKPLKELGLPLHDCGWIGWGSLLSRPWFGRVWIVQEFMNATQSTFMSGALAIPSELLIWFAFATGACASIGGAVAQYNDDIHNNRDIVWRSFALGVDKYARVKEEVNDTRIVDLWTRSQLLGATDPRDRVFALLSTQTAVSMNIVDYNKDNETVYREIASIALTIQVAQTNWHKTTPCDDDPSPSANVLKRTSRFLACKTQIQHSSNLPSWVPDWRPAGFRFVPLTRYFPGIALFPPPYNDAVIKIKSLFISGCIADHPSIIVDSMPYVEHDQLHAHLGNSNNKSRIQSWAKRILEWQIMCYLLALSFNSRQTKSEFLITFCRTMAFNALQNRGDTPDEEYITGFQALHNRLLNIMSKAVKSFLAFPNVKTPSDRGSIYESVFFEVSAGRKFAVTGKGDLAWVPKTTKLSDRVCFLVGCAVPFVVRPIGNSFELLGDCYLHSMMCDESIKFETKSRLFEFR